MGIMPHDKCIPKLLSWGVAVLLRITVHGRAERLSGPWCKTDAVSLIVENSTLYNQPVVEFEWFYYGLPQRALPGDGENHIFAADCTLQPRNRVVLAVCIIILIGPMPKGCDQGRTYSSSRQLSQSYLLRHSGASEGFWPRRINFVHDSEKKRRHK